MTAAVSMAPELSGCLPAAQPDPAIGDDDPEPRTVRAAGTALAEVGDERAIEPLRALAQTHPNPRFRKDAEKWVEKLEKKGEEIEEESEDS